MLFVIVVVGSLLIQLLVLALYRWRNTWRYRKRVGESVIVDVDPNNFERYRTRL
jgi:hypothetical protein